MAQGFHVERQFLSYYFGSNLLYVDWGIAKRNHTASRSGIIDSLCTLLICSDLFNQTLCFSPLKVLYYVIYVSLMFDLKHLP